MSTIEVSSGWVLAIPSLSTTLTITVVDGDTVYYQDHVGVSTTQNQGFLTAGENAVFTQQQWLISAGMSNIKLDYVAPLVLPVAALPGTVVMMDSGPAPRLNAATVEVDQNVLYYDAASAQIKGKVVGAGGGGVTTFNTRGGAVTLAKSDVTGTGLASTDLTDTALLARLAGPTFSGTPTAPTAVPLSNTTQLATTAYDDAAVAVEKARALAAEALLAPSASPALTGSPTVPTATPGTNTTRAASTAYADAATAVEAARALAAEALLAPKASPTFSGTTTAPEFSASGLTGAGTASRWVGATVSGAPVSGTFVAGDWVIDLTAAIWVCTSGGTPGTWKAAGTPPPTTIAHTTQTASYTAVLGDAGTIVEMNSAGALNFTVPPHSSVALAVDTILQVRQEGLGQTTLVPGAGVTLRAASSLTTRAQYSAVTLHQRATDEWVVGGDAT